jgi:hypothetical protein
MSQLPKTTRKCFYTFETTKPLTKLRPKNLFGFAFSKKNLKSGALVAGMRVAVERHNRSRGWSADMVLLALGVPVFGLACRCRIGRTRLNYGRWVWGCGCGSWYHMSGLGGSLKTPKLNQNTSFWIGPKRCVLNPTCTNPSDAAPSKMVRFTLVKGS